MQLNAKVSHVGGTLGHRHRRLVFGAHPLFWGEGGMDDGTGRRKFGVGGVSVHRSDADKSTIIVLSEWAVSELCLREEEDEAPVQPLTDRLRWTGRQRQRWRSCPRCRCQRRAATSPRGSACRKQSGQGAPGVRGRARRQSGWATAVGENKPAPYGQQGPYASHGGSGREKIPAIVHCCRGRMGIHVEKRGGVGEGNTSLRAS